MFENNNKAIVRKITKCALLSDMRRNFFIASAITLTAFMIASVFSVGMSKKQMRLMLRCEGAIYCILTIAASITAGTGIVFMLFSLLHNQDPTLLPKFM